MTTIDLATATRRPRVASHLLRTQLLGFEVLFFGFVAVIGVGAAAFHLFITEITGSVWTGAVQIVYWFALGMGVYLTAVYLPVYVAHGRTRREVAVGSAVFSVTFAVWLAVAVLIAFALEAGVFRLLGWTSLGPDPHPLGSLSTASTTFGRYAATFLGWTVAGALGGAAFYRRTRLGLAMVPICLAVLAATEPARSPGLDVPGTWGLVATFAEAPPIAAIGLALAGALLAAVATWFIVRDLPMRPAST